jgi:pyruvate,water dikinase
MVRSDKSASGVIFTIDPDTGFNNTIIINGIWGLGENIVQGIVTPDEWVVFKPTLHNGNWNPILKKTCGSKEFTMRYSDKYERTSIGNTIKNSVTPVEKQNRFCLSDKEIIQLSQWCFSIEKHYRKPMDIEWAKDGLNGQIYIVQARPETIHGNGNRKVRATFLKVPKKAINYKKAKF